MPLFNNNVIDISLQTTAVSQQGFETPIFIGAHALFGERVKSYTSLPTTTEVPDGTPERAALVTAFAQTPRPSVVKLGRREADLTLTPLNVTDGAVYTITITVNDGDNVTATYTAGALDDEEAVVDNLKADIDAVTAVTAHITATKVGTGASATLDITTVATGDFYVVSGATATLQQDYTATEAAASVLTAIREEDDDFFYITAHDHTQAFITAMALEVETTSKRYFVCVQDANVLTSWDGVSTPTDTLGLLAFNNYGNSIGVWHHQADTIYPEIGYICRFSWLRPGKADWEKKVIAGVPLALNASGNKLTTTELGYLTSRNASTVISFGGQSVISGGKAADGEWIEAGISARFLEARLLEGMQQLQLNNYKISFTNPGINRYKGTISTILNRYVDRDGTGDILDPERPFILNFPKASEVSVADKQAGILRITGTLYLAGAIRATEITLIMTYNNI